MKDEIIIEAIEEVCWYGAAEQHQDLMDELRKRGLEE